MTIVNIPVHVIVNNDLPPAIDVTIECIRSKLSCTMETGRPMHPCNADEMGRKIDSTLPISHHSIIGTRANHVICFIKGSI